MTSFKARIRWTRPEKKKINTFVPFRSNPTCNRKFQKNSTKIEKN